MSTAPRRGKSAARPQSYLAGFTLVELMVVLAIIAIITAILFPVFAKTRENARRASCQSNLKQIGLGMAQYTQDNDETYPRFWNGGVYNDPGNLMWATAILPYLKNRQVFKCPSDSVRGNTGNSYLGHNWLDNQPIAVVPDTASLIFVSEGYTGDSGGDPANQYDSRNAASQYGLNADYSTCGSSPCVGRFVRVDRGLPRHFGTNNLLFADGHVKASKPLPAGGEPIPNGVAAAFQALYPCNPFFYQGNTLNCACKNSN